MQLAMEGFDMKLSAPLFRLKHQAKKLSRQAGIPLHQALDRMAQNEGFASWSLLAARHSSSNHSSNNPLPSSSAQRMLAGLAPGDTVLLGARPGQGKTLMALHLICEAIRSGGRGIFYTLEYTQQDVDERLLSLGENRQSLGNAFACDTSDMICADYIMDQLDNFHSDANAKDLVVIDYLQLLDQQRDKPVLSAQIAALKAFARKSGAIIIFISQIDRAYDPSRKPVPDAQDVRLPNPVDLTLFNKAYFLHGGQVKMEAMG